MSHDFIIVNADTDSISFCKKDHSNFSKEEQEFLLKEINDLLPENIKFEHDGFFPVVIVFKAKNYALWDGKKLKIKGSALKGSTREPALKEFLDKVINSILTDKKDFLAIYNAYVKEIMDIKDMKRWVTRKTISEKTLESERTNETKIQDVIEDTEYVQGDRIYTYFKVDGSLGLLETFNSDYDKVALLKKLYKTGHIFSTVLPTDDLFPNFSLKKKNQDKLKEILTLGDNSVNI